jgi:phosphopantothenoylcysteine decarboxylase/phosphopantothenate--cysteine ligase
MSNIILGVTGGIACYKAVYLLRGLKKLGHDVRVIMTKDACRFVAPLTFETLSGSPAVIDGGGSPLEHIELAKWADIAVIAPATANTIAKLAHGLADNILTAAILAVRCDVMIFPAMNDAMYKNPATRDNLALLKPRGVYVAEAAFGELACDDEGVGRLQEPEKIVEAVSIRLGGGEFSGVKILVTAGPTAEEIDAVRCISNYSSGKMGYAIAEAAEYMGAEVTLISGPTSLKPPAVKTLYVKSAADMLKAVKENFISADILIMAAAVADYTPLAPRTGKIKKTENTLTIELVRTADTLKDAAKNKRKDQFIVGFAAESEEPEANALAKLKEKALDLIVLNDISKPGIGFNSDNNEVTLFFADGERIFFAKQPKREIAVNILRAIAGRRKKL